MKIFPVLDPVATGARIRELRNENQLTVDDVREFWDSNPHRPFTNGREEKVSQLLTTCMH